MHFIALTYTISKDRSILMQLLINLWNFKVKYGECVKYKKIVKQAQII